MSILNRFMYAIWYFRRPPWDSGVTPPELMDFIKSRPAGKAIDLGCGTGTNCITLAQLGWQVTGLDFVPSAIQQARKKACQVGLDLDLRVADVTHLEEFDCLFDFALDLGCFHNLSLYDKAAYLNQLDRIMRPESIWFVYGFLGLAEKPGSTGISSRDLDEIQIKFKMISRKEGFDHGQKPSAYFIFEKLDNRHEKAE